jgi:hypothetical protein
MKSIRVDPPTSDARRERVERRVFEQLAAVRVVERTDAVIPVDLPSRRWLVPAGALALAAAAALVFVLARGPEGEPPQTAQPSPPSRIVTPAGATSRFTVGEDAVIDAGSDTSVEVQHTAAGGITLVLARGSVDCDVAPRAGRPPFRVVSGDVQVEVVGTRFTVTRTPAARVDVVRGKVKVTAPGGSWLVTAGESWPETTAQVVPPPAPVPVPTPVIDEKIEVAPAAPVVVKKPAAPKLDDLAAEKAIDQAKDPIAATEAWLKQFPHSTLVEDVTYHRVELLVRAGRKDEAGRVAADYLKQFPHGVYRDAISALAAQK